MMVAPLGRPSVGAIGLCAQFSGLMFSCYWGFVGGGSLFFAQYWGSRENDGIERSYGLTLCFMTAVAVIFSGLALFAPNLMMNLYTDKVNIQRIGIQYLRVAGFAYPLQVLSMCMSALLRSTERVRIPLVASGASVSTNLLLNWVFIYGKLGVPAMGVRGAALATTCAAAVNVLVIYIAARVSGYPFLFHVRNHFKWTGAHTKAYLIKCFPIICNELLIGVGNLVGKCVGAGELDTAYQRAKRLVYLCSGVIFATGMIVLALHKPILTAMSLSGESLRAGVTIYIFVSLIRMGNWIQNDTYRASGDAVAGTVLEIVFMYLMMLPAVLISGFVVQAPYWVIFLCCYIDEPRSIWTCGGVLL